MDAIVASFEYCLNYLRDQVADVSHDDMVAQPDGIKNHPTWTIGHLTFSCQAMGGQIGLEAWLPESWPKQFGMGSVPTSVVADYEPKGEMLQVLGDAQSRLTRRISELTQEQLEQPLPEIKYAPVLPTVRHALVQILVSHSAYHVGQVAIWRRRMGMDPIDQPFL